MSVTGAMIGTPLIELSTGLTERSWLSRTVAPPTSTASPTTLATRTLVAAVGSPTARRRRIWPNVMQRITADDDEEEHPAQDG